METTRRSRGPLIPRSSACVLASPRAPSLAPRRHGSQGRCLRFLSTADGTPTVSSIARDWPFPPPRLCWAASGPGQASRSGRGDQLGTPWGGDARWRPQPCGEAVGRRVQALPPWLSAGVRGVSFLGQGRPSFPSPCQYKSRGCRPTPAATRLPEGGTLARSWVGAGGKEVGPQ